MPALLITPAAVVWQSGPTLTDQVAGEAFAAGALLYRSASGDWRKAQCDGAAIEAGEDGLAMALATADAAGARITLAVPGAIVAVGAGDAGELYCIGPTAGTLVPAADLEAPQRVTVAALGIGSGRVLVARIYHAGAVLA